MSGTDPAPTAATEAQLDQAMDAELDALQAQAPGGGTHVRNPVFRHEQAVGTAVADDEATETAARVAGSLAAEADQERLTIERQVADIEAAAPGSAQAVDAEAALARAERDADEAVTESLDSDEAAEQARAARGSHVFHRGADPAAAEHDRDRALADEAVAARDLADLDGLEARVASDAAAVPPAHS